MQQQIESDRERRSTNARPDRCLCLSSQAWSTLDLRKVRCCCLPGCFLGSLGGSHSSCPPPNKKHENNTQLSTTTFHPIYYRDRPIGDLQFELGTHPSSGSVLPVSTPSAPSLRPQQALVKRGRLLAIAIHASSEQRAASSFLSCHRRNEHYRSACVLNRCSSFTWARTTHSRFARGLGSRSFSQLIFLDQDRHDQPPTGC